jgi:hypothetical protein
MFNLDCETNINTFVIEDREASYWLHVDGPLVFLTGRTTETKEKKLFKANLRVRTNLKDRVDYCTKSRVI